MFRKLITVLVLFFTASLLVACGSDKEAKKIETNTATTNEKKAGSSTSATGKKLDGRWYTSAQLIRGKKVFAANCAVCHGDSGQGLTENWREALPDGTYPAPPVNGTAHAWHHSKEALLRTVNNGGVPLGGTMPAFNDKLSENEKEAVLAHVMSFWSNDIYAVWKKRNP